MTDSKSNWRREAGRPVGADRAPLTVPTEYTSRRLVGIQVLRGFAALMIVFHHVQDQSLQFKSIWPTEVGQAGVDLFFVISGFVMVFVTQRRERSSTQFLAMRAARIIPIYWFYTLGAALLMFVLPQLFRSNELTLRHVVLSLLFIPHQSGADSISPIVKQGWTLNYEVFFYVLFAIAMAISLRRRVLLSVGVLVIFTLVGYAMQYSGVSFGTADFYFANIILEFAFGMLIAKVYLLGMLEKVYPIVGFIAVPAGFLAMVLLDPLYDSSNRAFVYGLPAVLIISGALVIENRRQAMRMPALQFIGDASYSIYLVHGFPIAALRVLWPHGPFLMQGVLSFVLFLLISCILAVGFGGLSYYAIERTSLRYLRKKIVRRSA